MRLLGSPFARLVLGLVALGIPLAAVPRAGWGDLNLSKLECINPEVVLPAERASVVTQEELLNVVMAKVKARLPRLRIDTACANGLYLRVLVTKRTTEAGQTVGYFGAVRLEVLRTAIMLDTMARIELTAWQEAAALSGPPADERTAILGAVNGLLDSFATAYDKAGNP